MNCLHDEAIKKTSLCGKEPRVLSLRARELKSVNSGYLFWDKDNLRIEIIH